MANTPIKKRYRLKLNSLEKIEELLQELYNEADKSIVECQNQLTRLTSSIDMNEEIADAKAKIAKAINDYIKSKDNAIGRKLEIAKLMTEIHKYNGNVAGVMADTNIAYDIEKLKSQYANMSTEIDNNNPQTEREEYSIK